MPSSVGKVRKFDVNAKLSRYSHIQMIFGTDAGKVERDDEWMTDRLFNEIRDAIPPETLDIENEGVAWYDRPVLHVVCHGYDESIENSEEPDFPALAFVAAYFDLKKGIITKIESEIVE